MKSKQEEIINIAAGLFHEYGFKGTTLQMIAQKMNMEAPSLYNHINSKDQILSEILLPVAKAFMTKMDQISSSQVSALDKLERLISFHVSLSREKPHQMALMIHDWHYLKKKEKEAFIAHRNTYEEKFVAIIQRSVENGQIRDLDVSIILFNLLTTLRSMYAFVLRYKDYNTIDLEENIKNVLLNGIKKDSPGFGTSMG
ncbi:MAG: TetR/AcrR family transcriptional regulator [Bacteroidota bacterium]